MNYGEKIKAVRERIGLTQVDIAKIIKINNKTYSHYENEDDNIPLKHLITICDYLNISLDYVFNFSKIMQYTVINKEIDRKKIGNSLKKIREENKLTQTQLAKVLNTVQPVIVNYENGKFLIATPFLYTICKKYNISADYLLGRIGINTLKKER